MSEPVCTCIRGGHAHTPVAECPTHSAENDAPCLHVRVSLIYAPPGGRWACDSCGASFHPVALSCVIPPGEGH